MVEVQGVGGTVFWGSGGGSGTEAAQLCFRDRGRVRAWRCFVASSEHAPVLGSQVNALHQMSEQLLINYSLQYKNLKKYQQNSVGFLVIVEFIIIV